MIDTPTILARRLCLVCARDGIEKPVQEHECEHAGHFGATLHALTGRWVAESYLSGIFAYYLPDNPKHESELDFRFLPQFTDADLWRMACAVGELIKKPAYVMSNGQVTLSAIRLVDRDEYEYNTPREPIWFAGYNIAKHYDTAKEAVLRAYMDRAWETAAKGVE